MFWRIYFFFFTVVIVWGFFTLPYEPSFSLIVYLDRLFEILQIIALFGFVYERKILTPLFWKITLFCTILTGLIYSSAIYAQYAPVVFVVALFINAPAIYALFLYAFKYLPEQVGAQQPRN